MKTEGRDMFGSRAAAVLAMAGSAIGLGNIWRFPYMVGQNGGAAFILVYLAFALFLSIPIFLSESIIGRTAHKGTFGAFKALDPDGKWHFLAFVTVLSPMILISYYSVVGGWSLHFFAESLIHGFDSSAIGVFDSFTGSGSGPVVCHSFFLLFCIYIVSAGVKSGIERFNRYVMPVLFVLMLAIMVYSLCLPGSMGGVRYMLKPDFGKLSAAGVASAMGQSFFSLSLGVGTILTYSSYLHSKEDILSSGLGTAAFDLLFALIAGFAIMPAVFAAGIEPGAGPGLVFDTIPYIFAKMGENMPVISRVVSILFFLSLLVAAVTSAISMLEVGVAFLVEERGMARKKASALVFAFTWLVGVFCAVGPALFNTLDHLVSDYLMAFGGLIFTLFVGWKMDKTLVRKDFTNDGSRNNKVFVPIYFIIKYVAPIGIAVIFITNLVL